MNIKKKKTSKWISKEGTSLLVILFIWEESFSISHSSIMNSENHWRAKKMDVLANYRPGAERKFPDHYRILVASKCWTQRREGSWSCENNENANDDYNDDNVEEAADDHDDDHVDVVDGLVSSLFHTKFTPDCRWWWWVIWVHCGEKCWNS